MAGHNEGERFIVLYMPREEGQGLVEYALILMFVALVAIVVVYVLGQGVGNLYQNIMDDVLPRLGGA